MSVQGVSKAGVITGDIKATRSGLFVGGGFDSGGGAFRWPHGLRALASNEIYVPIVTMALNANDYQLIVNTTGVDSTNIYCNVMKINATSISEVVCNSYGGPTQIAWTLTIIVKS